MPILQKICRTLAQIFTHFPFPYSTPHKVTITSIFSALSPISLPSTLLRRQFRFCPPPYSFNRPEGSISPFLPFFDSFHRHPNHPKGSISLFFPISDPFHRHPSHPKGSIFLFFPLFDPLHPSGWPLSSKFCRKLEGMVW